LTELYAKIHIPRGLAADKLGDFAEFMVKHSFSQQFAMLKTIDISAKERTEGECLNGLIGVRMHFMKSGAALASEQERMRTRHSL
jgi:hypothetical protein